MVWKVVSAVSGNQNQGATDMIPDYFKPSLEMLDATFPGGPPDGLLSAILFVLYHDGEMSMRSVEHLMSLWTQRDATDFTRPIDQIAREDSTPKDVQRVLEHLVSDPGHIVVVLEKDAA